MKVTMVIPTYWGRKKSEGFREKDSIYDHPTPLDEAGTLGRTLESLSILKNRDFNLVILGVSTAPDIREEVESKISSIVKDAALEVEMLFFSYSHLAKVHQHLTRHKKASFIPLLQLDGYSNVRNLCLFSAHLSGSDSAVLIDDDEIFEDSLFMEKTLEFIGKKHKKNDVLAVAGYYINPDGDYLINKEIQPWMEHWNKIDCMNRAFKEIIGQGPRLKETPFVFGGNAVIHRDLFMRVPFDPMITRGEDIDFLINSKMFGFKFFLDNQLSIKHDAPPRLHPEWRKVREDILRFVFEKRKLETQKAIPGMVKINAEDLGIYPGEFLKEDLEERIIRSNKMLAMDYSRKGDKKGVAECMKNIHLAQTAIPPEVSPFENLVHLQKKWINLMEHFSSMKVRQEVGGPLGFPLD
ncbi:MAG: hypothetical protein PVI11_09220 [Candidatus Aminicenantes bacterium]|jgi:hypothetical protein